MAKLNVPLHHELAVKQANEDWNLTSNRASIFKLVFKLEIFWKNNKTIIRFAFRMVWKIMQI